MGHHTRLGIQDGATRMAAYASCRCRGRDEDQWLHWWRVLSNPIGIKLRRVTSKSSLWHHKEKKPMIP